MIGLELYSQWRNWMAAQWKALPEEKRAEWDAEMHGGKMEDKDMGEAMLSLLGF